MKEVVKDLIYIKGFFETKKSALILLLITVFTMYTFAILQNTHSAIFNFRLIGFGGLLSFATYTLINTLFFGSKITALVFFFTTTALSAYAVLFFNGFKNNRRVSDSSLGLIAGIFTFFGLGCASCGGLILVSLLGFFGVTGVVALLPFNGYEIQFLALFISILVLLIYSRKTRSKVCLV